jgi:hypothetical protein
MTDDERHATITKLQAAFNDLHKDAYEKDPVNARQRGLEFEKLVQKVFKAWGMLVRGSFYTDDDGSEQIDGVVTFDHRVALLESKWVKGDLAASELFAFLGKVEGKFIGTIGIFVSRNELTEHFLTALRAGRRQCIMVIHGRDVEDLFDPDFRLDLYLSQHLHYVCTSNSGHLSTAKFVAKQKAKAAKKKSGAAAAPAPDSVEQKLKECLKDKTSKNIVHELADELTEAQRVESVKRIVTNYADIAADGNDDGWRIENLGMFLKELVERLPETLTDADTTFFMGKLSRDFQSSHYGPMTENFAPRYVYLNDDDRKKVEERLLRQWDSVIGEWMSENRMAVPTRFLWEYLGEDTKTHLIGHFVGFVLSSRGSRHPQHQLADFVLDKNESVSAAKKALRRQAKETAKSWFEDAEYRDAEGVKKVEKRVLSALEHMKQYIPDFKEVVSTGVKKSLEEFNG